MGFGGPRYSNGIGVNTRGTKGSNPRHWNEKNPPYNDKEMEIIERANFENWFEINSGVASKIYNSVNGVDISVLAEVHTNSGKVIKTLNNAMDCGILWNRGTGVGGRGNTWFMTILGRKYFYYVYVLELKWDWEAHVEDTISR